MFMCIEFEKYASEQNSQVQAVYFYNVVNNLYNVVNSSSIQNFMRTFSPEKASISEWSKTHVNYELWFSVSYR